MKGYKIINRFRFFTTISIITLIIFASIFTVVVNAKGNDTNKLISVYVQQGDTLWGLSSRYAGDNMDIRRYISTVMNINNLSSANIKPGKLLYFPLDKRN